MKKARFRVEVKGVDMTRLIADRFLGMTISDNSGEQSDRFAITMDNRDDLITFPRTGVKVGIWIGNEGEPLTDKGLYTLDEISEDLNTGEIEISGNSADMTGPIRTPKTRTWEAPLTLGQLLEKVGKECGYTCRVHPKLMGIPIGHQNQRAESDLNLITRSVRARGGMVKVANGMIVATPKSSGENAAGTQIPLFVISDPSESSGRVTIQERGSYGAVQCSYFDEGKQQVVNLVVKSGEGQTLVLKGQEKTKEAAQARAEARLGEQERGRAEMSLTRPLTPEIIAPAKVQIVGHRQSANGVWFVETVDHEIGKDRAASSVLRLSTKEHEASKKG
ncbi:contractile injection system protein, VgrG/Pvc8 family [Aeromonas aquatica]|uniref:contractile injection system protein, VgrG/Pvc8 family n=1 Tax=Aeromonas aquatica TaxID=558964 RepID=UPI00051B31F6|nr:contractile injection system protein, VgrG/Pvc8 family [Aeromonas aquatica]